VSTVTNAFETLPISAEGHEQRCRELDALRNDAALQDLLDEQAQLERRIARLKAQLAAAEIVAPAPDGRVGIGSVVRVRDGNGERFEFELVGPLESDVANGRVSIGAPVGEALVGRRAGARVEVATPRGQITLEVVSVRPLGVRPGLVETRR
jgi:transcription elongation factor GreA